MKGIFNVKCFFDFLKNYEAFSLIKAIESFLYVHIGLHIQYAMFLSDRTWIIMTNIPQIH